MGLCCQGKNENRFQDSPVSVFLFQGEAGSFFGKSPCITGSVLKKRVPKAMIAFFSIRQQVICPRVVRGRDALMSLLFFIDGRMKMKKQDLVFIVGLGLVFCPFFLSRQVLGFYMTLVGTHALVMSFIKFAVLATLGEVIGLRISRGVYRMNGFGILPRSLVWGCLGVGIQLVFVLFAVGAPVVVSKFVTPLPSGVLGQAFSGGKLLAAFAISVSLNLIFAPVFMTLHRVTDMHIQETGGTLRGFFTPIDFSRMLGQIDWQVMWGFVFKKTLLLFWIPAHTITFLLPEMHRVLFAALLGIVLGTILAIASLAKSGRRTVLAKGWSPAG